VTEDTDGIRCCTDEREREMERDLDEILSKIQEHVAQEETTGYLEIHLENYH